MIRGFIFFFFFNDTATTEIYTLSLHDALPIYYRAGGLPAVMNELRRAGKLHEDALTVSGKSMGENVKRAKIEDADVIRDRKSTRLNSSHLVNSYAVFCLKKKKKQQRTRTTRHT